MIDANDIGAIEDAIADIPKLRENRAWRSIILPWLENAREQHLAGMLNVLKPASERCEHIAAWHLACEQLVSLDREERRLGEILKRNHQATGFIHRSFSKPPVA